MEAEHFDKKCIRKISHKKEPFAFIFNTQRRNIRRDIPQFSNAQFEHEKRRLSNTQNGKHPLQKKAQNRFEITTV